MSLPARLEEHAWLALRTRLRRLERAGMINKLTSKGQMMDSRGNTVIISSSCWKQKANLLVLY